MTSNNDKASQAFEDWLNRQYSKSQRDKFDLDDYRRLKDSFLAGVASVAQDRDGVREAAIEECAKVVDARADEEEKVLTTLRTYQSASLMKARVVTARGIADDLRALKRQPKEEGERG
jgi:hypothetical protein